MKHFITGFSLSLFISASLCAGIIYVNQIPLCAINPFDGCKLITTDYYKNEQARLAALLEEAGVQGADLEQRINSVITTSKNHLATLKETVGKMASQFDTQPITDSNLALVAANQKLLTLKEKVNELKTLLCNHAGVPTNQGDCSM